MNIKEITARPQDLHKVIAELSEDERTDLVAAALELAAMVNSILAAVLDDAERRENATF